MNDERVKAIKALAELGRSPAEIVKDSNWDQDDAPTLGEVKTVLGTPSHASPSARRKTNHFLTLNGVTKTLSEWSDETGINRKTICERIKAGWSTSDALTIPAKIMSQEYRLKQS